MKRFSFWQWIIFILGSELIGSLGSIATTPAIHSWFVYLVKPVFSPPNWLFGPVWTLLFALMGTSAYLVYRNGTKKKDVRGALVWFGMQFALNVLWSFAFFGARNPLFGLVTIVFLWFAIVQTMVKFFRVSKPAGYLLIPYLFWVSFAAYLNMWLWFLNR